MRGAPGVPAAATVTLPRAESVRTPGPPQPSFVCKATPNRAGTWELAGACRAAERTRALPPARAHQTNRMPPVADPPRKSPRADSGRPEHESVLTCYSRRQPAINSDVTQRGRPAGERRRARLTAAATSATARHRTVNVDGWGRGATPTRQSPLAARRPAVGENEQEGRVTGEQFRPASARALHACRHKCDGRLES
jgi:hypothetical protein